MTRDEQFVWNFMKSVDILWENKPKDMSIWVFIYARDISNKTKQQPDWTISFHSARILTKYDKMWIRQSIEETLMSIDD